MGKRLLVVDDDARLTNIVALTAKTLGIETRQENDPTRVLDAFIAFGPHVVMIDIFMPEMDGIDVLNEILLVGTPASIVLMSGNDDLLRVAQDTVQFHGLAAAPVLMKPFRRADLVAVLTQAMA